MFFEIYDAKYPDRQPELAYETECDTKEECIDEFIAMIYDCLDMTKHMQIMIDKLRAGEYEYEENAEIVGEYEDKIANYILVYTYK